MNDLAREALIEADLKGTKQSFGEYKTYSTWPWKYGEVTAKCAMAVLDDKYKELHNLPLCNYYDPYKILAFYEIGQKEVVEIIEANDRDHWSFLEIARKIGVQEETL